MNSMHRPFNLIVMGVSGCGKSTIAKALAARLHGHFADGDDFHPQENLERMSRGVALTDADRLPWLFTINQYMREVQPGREVNVVACSALKRIYRDVLSESATVLFVHLVGDFALIEARSQAREGHFMNVGLLQSQFDTLEEPTEDESAISVSIDTSIDAVINNAVNQVKKTPEYRNYQQNISASQ